MTPRRLFTEHPESVGESYADHLWAAGGFGLRMVLGGLACMVHALLPFLFQRTASDCIADLHQRMVARQRRPQQQTARLRPRSLGRAAIR